MNILKYRKTKSDLYVSKNGRLVIRDTDYAGESVRVLLVDDTRESATFNAPEKRNELIFEYTKGLNHVLDRVPSIREVLMIGGAGFSYPKYFISHFPDKRMDVVEIDARMVDLAMKYFYLDELYEDYHLRENHRLSVIIADGSEYLNTCRRHYDAIFNDAYIGRTPDKGLLTEAAAAQIKNILTKEGVYCLNLITALTGPYSMTGLLTQEILKNHFAHVSVLPCTTGRTPEQTQNCVIIATDLPTDFSM